MFHVGLDELLVERLPAADPLADVIHVVDGAVAVVVAEPVRLDVLLGDGEDLDLVVGQEVLPDGRREGQVVELVAVDLLVIHRRQLDELVLGALLGVLAVDARRGGHVESPFAADVLVAVYLREVGLLRPLEGGAGRAVGLVADDQVERAERAGLLGLGDGVDGLVGREDHRHALRRLELQGEAVLDEAVRGRGRGEAQVADRDVAFLAVGLAVGADGQRGDLVLRLLRPDTEALRKERNRRHHEQHRLALQLFGDAERGEGLARAASHDELAAVGGLESLQDVVDCLGLVGEIVEPLDDGPALLEVEGPGVLDGLAEEGKTDAGDGRVLQLDRVLGVGGPVVVRRDEDALDKLRRPAFDIEGLAGRREERVHVLLRDRRPRLVALALDRREVAEGVARDEVDADVVPVLVGELAPQPDVREMDAGVGRGLEVLLDEPFELGAEVGAVVRLLPYLLQEFVECHASVPSSPGTESGFHGRRLQKRARPHPCPPRRPFHGPVLVAWRERARVGASCLKTNTRPRPCRFTTTCGSVERFPRRRR